ncbi:MAG: phosphatase PAP2 family protein [Anaerolineae bacterium]|nr:phosphatase PAP2 family protein [Anaerolineae bacterium]
MREALLSWLPWNIRMIVAIQQASPAWLDLLMRGITYLGSTYFFLVLLPVVYWLRPVPGMQLAVLVLASAYVNTAAKTLLAIERPFVVSSDVIAKVTVGYYAFPSGHAQLAASTWPMLAAFVRKRWFTALAAVMIVMIGISRIVLGVHYPQDVLAGWVLGLTIYLLHEALVEPIDGWVARRGLGTHLALAVGIPLVLTLLLLLEEATTVTGAMLGMGVGFALNAHAGRFAPRGELVGAIGRIALGLLLVGTVYLLPKLLLGEPAQPWAALLLHLARYTLVSLTGTLVAAWCFMRTGLAARTAAHVAA